MSKSLNFDISDTHFDWGDDGVGFHGETRTTQRASANQIVLTDSTGGAVSDAVLVATSGIFILPIHLALASMTTAAADLITNYVLGFRFKLLAVSFVVTKLGTGASASQVLNFEIGSTNVTGGVLTLLLADTDTLGKKTDATAITAANVGTAADTLSLEVATSGVVFTAGEGLLLLRIQNMDAQDNFAKTAELVNEIRAALVAKGLIKGAA